MLDRYPGPARRQEVVHDAPVNGLSFTPCCDRTLQELPVYDRISPREHEVTCNRLDARDEWLLTAQPGLRPGGASGDDAPSGSEQVLFELAVSVRAMCGPQVSLPRAYRCVRAAVRELAPTPAPGSLWNAGLMVDIATRAGQLAR
jgi:hypothetical protein